MLAEEAELCYQQIEDALSSEPDELGCDEEFGDAPLLPSGFSDWLGTALREELSGSDADSAMAVVEAVLSSALENPSAACELLKDAADMLTESYSAANTARDLADQWFSFAVR